MYYVVQALVLFACVCLTFVFNAHLQKRLMARQNREKMIDLLLDSIENQSRFYAAYWETGAAEGEVSVSTNQTMQQTRFSALLNTAANKYGIKNIDAIRDQYGEFSKLATGGDFGAKNRAADTGKARRIHAAANQVYICLLEHKA